MKRASRTLVKSPPELWELIDQPDRMQGLMCALLGRATEVTVDRRKPESVLRWQAAGGSEKAWIEVELAEKGWGTNVSVTAEGGHQPTKLEGWLDAVLDELATPQKRPFADMEAPAPNPVPDLASVEARVDESPAAEAEAPVSEAPVEAPLPPPEKKRRRLFGLL